jgi:hypothetical protein
MSRLTVRYSFGDDSKGLRGLLRDFLVDQGFERASGHGGVEAAYVRSGEDQELRLLGAQVVALIGEQVAETTRLNGLEIRID